MFLPFAYERMFSSFDELTQKTTHEFVVTFVVVLFFVIFRFADEHRKCVFTVYNCGPSCGEKTNVCTRID